jgi:hypothetical protein
LEEQKNFLEFIENSLRSALVISGVGMAEADIIGGEWAI